MSIEYHSNSGFSPKAYYLPDHKFFSLVSSSRHDFHLMDWALNLIKKQLVTPITLMPQNTNGYALSCSSLIVAHRAHDSGRLLMIIIPQQLAKHLIEL